MAIPFLPDERERIRAELLDAGARLFAKHGLARTSLTMLTAPAGIAKASFYAFFASKEELYLDLLAREAPSVASRVLAPLNDRSPSAREAITAYLRAVVAEYAANPLLVRLLRHPEELAAVAAKVRPEDLRRKAAWFSEPLTAFLIKRRARGEIADVPDATALGILRAVPLLLLHRDRFVAEGDGALHAVLDALIVMVADGLTATSPRPVSIRERDAAPPSKTTT